MAQGNLSIALKNKDKILTNINLPYIMLQKEKLYCSINIKLNKINPKNTKHQ